MPDNTDARARIDELQEILKEASDAYYNRDIEIMSNYEYDALYDELVSLEESTGYIRPDSITQNVGSSVSSTALPKVEHASPMLSLAKTKSRDELASWLGKRRGCLSYKLDGSTVVLTYRNGKLAQAVTRGNGRIGEDITVQSRKFACVPKTIPFTGELVVRGEALMTYSEFNRVNATQDDGAKYKNPRNLASGTMRALDASILDERTVEFHPFTLVSADGYEEDSFAARLDWLETLGFSPVEHFTVSAEEVAGKISEIEKHLPEKDFPSDGLVLFFDEVAYGNSLGSTGHHPRNGIAFKWADETAETTLTGIAWQPSRTGRINPVALFEPVELEGTTVEKATLHNLTIIEEVLGRPYIGQPIEVYKANAIIPAVLSAVKAADGEDFIDLPEHCPACGADVERRNDNGSEFLFCTGDDCPAKSVEVLAHFASRDALDIRGLSKKTIGKLMDAGIVSSFADILDIAKFEDKIIATIEEEGKKTRYEGIVEGFQKKSFDNLVQAIETAKKTEARRFLYSLGIREIGRSASRDICKAYGNDIEALLADVEAGNLSKVSAVEGVGPVMVEELRDYIERNAAMIRDLLARVEIVDADEEETVEEDSFISGKTFVITGAVHNFKNRNEFKSFVESHGGKVAGSVSKNTDYLVTNTPDSGSAKNKKAAELGVAVITEDGFCQRAGM